MPSSMDGLRIDEYIEGNDENFGLLKHAPGSNHKSHQSVENVYVNLVKDSLLLGADKFILARKSPGLSFLSSLEPQNLSPEKIKTGTFDLVRGEKFQSSSSQSDEAIESSEENCDNIPEVMSYGSTNYDQFSWDITAFVGVLALKLALFQVNVFMRFFRLPILLLNLWLTCLILPFQTVKRLREHLKQRLLMIWSYSCLSVISFTFNWLKAQKSLLKLMIRFCWALFWSIYVCLVLVGLLVMGFGVGWLTMRHLTEEPIQTIETLNFDYTKTSPAAFVPISSSPVASVSPSLVSTVRILTAETSGRRTIPYNHKLQLVVSLTVPESDYNRKLGVFQVKVECLSAEGKVTASSSYPTMLHFKSPTVRLFETVLGAIPLLTGFQSEVQNLKVQINDFVEGHDPTTCFKVTLEQRAEYQAGAGIPEIYAATLKIESKQTQMKRIIWNWRRTIFVWISIVSFLTEVMTVLIFCRPIMLPGTRLLRILGGRKISPKDKSWW